ncbi:Radial spoke head protein 3 [Sorochytrium milnesiophthora]
MMNSQTETYAFRSEPRAAPPAAKKKYRDRNAVQQQQQQQQAVNIMHDKRIYRGNTYASPVLPTHAQEDAVEAQRQNDIRRRMKALRRADMQKRPKTPDAVEGRQHADVQTELYLEEFADKVPEAYASTQTDAFLDRAPSPLYIPQKSGVDVETQILPGDLFDFDYEVEPILEVLVGKALEQSLMEVLEEEELASLRKRQKEFEEHRNAEFIEVQRLEEAEKRRTQEKERRKQEARRILEEKQQAVAKISARAFAENYLSALIPDVIDSLQRNGYFYDTVYKEVEQNYLPWLTAEVEKTVSEVAAAQVLVDDIIQQALFELLKRHEAPPAPAPLPVAAAAASDAAPAPAEQTLPSGGTDEVAAANPADTQEAVVPSGEPPADQVPAAGSVADDEPSVAQSSRPASAKEDTPPE